MLMKKVLVFVQAKEEHPELTKPQLCKMIGISDSSLKRIMKDLNMKSFYRHEVPVNRKKTGLIFSIWPGWESGVAYIGGVYYGWGVYIPTIN